MDVSFVATFKIWKIFTSKESQPLTPLYISGMNKKLYNAHMGEKRMKKS